MESEQNFKLEIECKVYDSGGISEVGQSSTVRSGEFVGWVSLTSDDLSLSVEDILELLDVAHAERSLAAVFLEKHNSQTGCLKELGVIGEFETEDVWMNGYVSKEYLEDVIALMDGGSEAVESIYTYDTPIQVRK